jgi:murein L,D-transpeptidase YcbB/YkuD
MIRAAVAFPLCIVLIFSAGCGTATPDPVSTALGAVLAGKPVLPVADDVWKDVAEFYRQREGKVAWLSDEPTRRTADTIDVLQSAQGHGLVPGDYGVADLEARSEALAGSGKDAPDRAQRLAELDARITTALLSLGRDVAVGRTTPQVAHWKARRTIPDLVGTLTQATGNVAAWLEKIQPFHPEYDALRGVLADLHSQRDKGGWSPVPAGKFTVGASHPAVVALRQRLTAQGHLTGEAATSESPIYGKDLDTAVREFQEHHAIKATGSLDAATRSAMNVPIEDRIQQVVVNLERWRWMPDDLGERHLFVNIPHFHLMARENGKVVSDIRVVVGKTGHETPIFSGTLETVVFSPYWNIPESIVDGETVPALLKDSDYLARNRIEILRVSDGGAAPVNPSSVKWDDPEALTDLAFRQLPGAGNALGHVKFLFPNAHNVYLHDTPADALFERAGRSFSHGCVRVEEPETLAKYVLRGDSAWSEPAILAAMNAGVEQHVKLQAGIPVHLVYFTVWVDDQKGAHYQPDVYGYDRRR